jgi:phosphate transport system substrate-binding protein
MPRRYRVCHEIVTFQRLPIFVYTVIGIYMNFHGLLFRAGAMTTMLLSILTQPSEAATQLNGAGSTFVAPIYQRWGQDYNKANSDVQVNYQSLGSGAGVKQFMAGTVDFGASDAAMSDEEISKVPSGVVLLPMTAGSIVLAYNLPGVTDLKLSRDAYTGIFLGKVTQWNDPLIAKDNPGVKLPDMPIAVAYRSDGSGTTFVFAKHLAAVSAEFKQTVGEGKQVTWPVGVGGKGNEGVTALIKQSPGTIGYVEYGYATHTNLPFATLQNKSGAFVKATPQSGAATLASVELPANLRIWPADPAGADNYPITTFSWVMVNKTFPDKAKWAVLKGWLLYDLTDGQKVAETLGYIPLPAPVVEKVKAALDTVQ